MNKEICSLCGGLFILEVGEVGDSCHVTRNDGGHIRIVVKRQGVRSLSDLRRKELMALGEAMRLASGALKYALTENGVPIGRVNCQINGNWSDLYGTDSAFCVHIYGRARNAKKQPFGQALNFPSPRENPDFYDGNEPLTDKDIALICEYVKENSHLSLFSRLISRFISWLLR